MTLIRPAIILTVFAALLIFSGCWGWGVERTSWQPTEPPSGTELHIGVWVGGCDSFDTVTVRDTDQDATLQAYIDDNTKSSCDDILRFEPHTVRLREPLLDRSLLGCNPTDAVYKLPENISNNDCATAIRFVVTP